MRWLITLVVVVAIATAVLVVLIARATVPEPDDMGVVRTNHATERGEVEGGPQRVFAAKSR